MSDILIRVENLGKQYRIGAKQQRYKTLRDTLADVALAPIRRLRPSLSDQHSIVNSNGDAIWALQDISLTIQRGEVVGIIGRNGAGKSTLLKILSRITEPTRGFAKMRGRVNSLLEVGTGFHPELTGRENIYLNAAILGMKRTEIDRKFDEIVAFAEVEKFVDTPVKRYSTGMQLRLAFAVAAHLEPQILIIDEVLAVGDAEFQKKCLGKVSDIAGQGRTILFVSHNMASIAQLSGRVIWLDGGRLKASGASSEIIPLYLSAGTSSRPIWIRPTTHSDDLDVEVHSAHILCSSSIRSAVVGFDKPFKIEIAYEVHHPVRNLWTGCRLTDSQGVIVWTSWTGDTIKCDGQVSESGRYVSTCNVPGNLLKPGRYFLSVGSEIYNGKRFGYYPDVLAFDVSEIGYPLNPGRLGVITPVLEWELKRVNSLDWHNLSGGEGDAADSSFQMVAP